MYTENRKVYIYVALNLSMSHTEIYQIKGNLYCYEVTNYREGETGKVKHKKKYLGPVEPKRVK